MNLICESTDMSYFGTADATCTFGTNSKQEQYVKKVVGPISKIPAAFWLSCQHTY